MPCNFRMTKSSATGRLLTADFLGMKSFFGNLNFQVV